MGYVIDKYPIPKTCPHCGGKVIFTTNDVLYGRTYGNGKCYYCTNCGASVGTHGKAPKQPLGMLATPAMKGWKKNCHNLFDSVWKSGKLKRGQAYKRLAKALDIPQNECHFGHFDEPMLIKAWNILKQPDWWENYE